MQTQQQCPICQGSVSRSLIDLQHFPIYQHPMAADVTVEPPYEVDISYVYCVDCGHAYQSNYDPALLESIYRQHYYTPSFDAVAVKFKNDFRTRIAEVLGDDLARIQSVFEIGCSGGEVLADLESIFPQATMSGVEPNDENRAKARQRGYEVDERFFNGDFVAQYDKQYSFVFSRHVIEHVFDFDDYIRASSAVIEPGGYLCIETPSLDWAIEHNSRAPFHFEHVSLFTARSLQQLLSRHGWRIHDLSVTDSGNMIAICQRGATDTVYSVPAQMEHFYQLIGQKRQTEIDRVQTSKKIAIWGAGAGGRSLMSYLNLTPDVVLDNNPNKVGKVFVGYPQLPIELANDWVRSHLDEYDDWLLVISSTFFDEIQQSLQEMGWQGATYSPYQVVSG